MPKISKSRVKGFQISRAHVLTHLHTTRHKHTHTRAHGCAHVAHTSRALSTISSAIASLRLSFREVASTSSSMRRWLPWMPRSACPWGSPAALRALPCGGGGPGGRGGRGTQVVDAHNCVNVPSCRKCVSHKGCICTYTFRSIQSGSALKRFCHAVKPQSLSNSNQFRQWLFASRQGQNRAGGGGLGRPFKVLRCQVRLCSSTRGGRGQSTGGRILRTVHHDDSCAKTSSLFRSSFLLTRCCWWGPECL